MSILRKIPAPHPPGIIYVVTRAHGLRPHLLKPEDLAGLVRLPDLTAVVEALIKSDYAPAISKIPSQELNAIRLTAVLQETLADRLYFLAMITNGSVKKFFEGYARRLEVENVKRVLRAKSGGESIGEEALVPIPREYVTVNFPAMVGAKGFEECVGLLRATIYSPLVDKLDAYRQHGAALLFEGMLDGIYYGQLWEDVRKLYDNDIKRRVGIEMDLMNLMIALRMKSRNLPQDIIEQSLIRTYFKLGRGAMLDLTKEKPESAFDFLAGTHYGRYFSGLKSEIQRGLLSETLWACLRFGLCVSVRIRRKEPHSHCNRERAGLKRG
jgi:vacuolar-type H+-ATPase subunit C/Vma6